MFADEEDGDWEITKDGLYVATRRFLTRRGYCCANRCRNCPYINWRDDSTWQPVTPDAVRRFRVSPKAVAGAQAFLRHHERELRHCSASECDHHRAMMTHYRHLLQCWGAIR